MRCGHALQPDSPIAVQTDRIRPAYCRRPRVLGYCVFRILLLLLLIGGNHTQKGDARAFVNRVWHGTTEKPARPNDARLLPIASGQPERTAEIGRASCRLNSSHLGI